MKAEMIMENSDPITSPDKSTALSINELGEPWIDVVKTESLCSIAVLYFEEHHHEKTELPLLDINSFVLGDKTEPGCLVDWASLNLVLGKHGQDQLSQEDDRTTYCILSLVEIPHAEKPLETMSNFSLKYKNVFPSKTKIHKKLRKHQK